MRSLLSFLCFLFIPNFCFAQELPRKGSLGAAARNVETGSYIEISQVLSGSTAESVGIQQGDKLLSVNGRAFSQTSDLIAYTSTWRAGEELRATIRREDQKLTLSGTVKGKPLETSPHGEVIYGAVPFREGKLRSILELPRGVDRPPVLFFLQGFSCSSIDYYYDDQAPVKQLTEGLVEQGIAVFRVEKPGMGDCIGLPPCEEIGYQFEVEAFTAALRMLKEMEAVDTDNIYLFGHSLGGVTAPLLAEQVPVKGIINYGSVATSWYEYLLKVLREQEVIMGRDYETVERNVRIREPILHDFLVEKKTPKELAANPDYAPYLSNGLPALEGNYTLGRHYTFMPEINDVNLTRALKNADCRLLAIHGEYDIHAVDAEWAETQAAIVNAYRPGQGEWVILEGTEHGFATVPSMDEHIRLRNQGALDLDYMSEHYNPALTRLVAEWIEKVRKA